MKPCFPGTFVGQRWSRPGTQTVRKVSWKDRLTNETRFGRVLGKPAQVDEVVWDGSSWVSPQQFANGIRARLKERA